MPSEGARLAWGSRERPAHAVRTWSSPLLVTLAFVHPKGCEPHTHTQKGTERPAPAHHSPFTGTTGDLDEQLDKQESNPEGCPWAQDAGPDRGSRASPPPQGPQPNSCPLRAGLSTGEGLPPGGPGLWFLSAPLGPPEAGKCFQDESARNPLPLGRLPRRGGTGPSLLLGGVGRIRSELAPTAGRGCGCVSGSPRSLPRARAPALVLEAPSSAFQGALVRPTCQGEPSAMSKTSRTCSTCSRGARPGGPRVALGQALSLGQGHGHRSGHHTYPLAPGAHVCSHIPTPSLPESPPKPWCGRNVSQVRPGCGQRAPQVAVGRSDRLAPAQVGRCRERGVLCHSHTSSGWNQHAACSGPRAREAAWSAPGRAVAFLQRKGRSPVHGSAGLSGSPSRLPRGTPQARAELTAVLPTALRSLKGAPQ